MFLQRPQAALGMQGKGVWALLSLGLLVLTWIRLPWLIPISVQQDSQGLELHYPRGWQAERTILEDPGFGSPWGEAVISGRTRVLLEEQPSKLLRVKAEHPVLRLKGRIERAGLRKNLPTLSVSEEYLLLKNQWLYTPQQIAIINLSCSQKQLQNSYWPQK